MSPRIREEDNASNAPMSQRTPCGRVMPRWSVAGGGQLLAVTLSIARLPVSSAWVAVNPPLFCKGPSMGLALLRSPGWEKTDAQVPSLLRLPPWEVSPVVMEQLAPWLSARSVFLRFKTLLDDVVLFRIPPPIGAEFDAIV